jgi:hypothetical protein
MGYLRNYIKTELLDSTTLFATNTLQHFSRQCNTLSLAFGQKIGQGLGKKLEASKFE